MKNRLELTWIYKDLQYKLEPRILIENHKLSYGDKNSGNTLIQGDNLLALKALEKEFNSKIKCIYIDPPYNTGSAFSHYDDGIEHSLWLNLMKPRLQILKNLLSEVGSIWISIDDNECHYLKVLCDEIFGRNNFVSNIIWEKKSSPQNDAKWISDCHDHILVYAKNKSVWRPNKLKRTENHNSIYKNSDIFDGIDSTGKLYGRGPWFPGDMTVKTISQNCLYPITTPSGKIVKPAKGRAWVYNKEKFQELLNDNRIYFGKSGESKPTIKRFLQEIHDKGIVPKSVWSYKEVGENRNARQEVLKFNDVDPFSTPKPENLLKTIISIASNENEIVLDSFLGSGTTSAVAHKMNRKWIGIELGDHAKTHCVPRLKAVVDGEQGGISKEFDWNGGGGFKFYTLAPSLLNEDKYGNWVISNEYNANMLASAIARLEGFKYEPDEYVYWKQGFSSEKDFIFTTTHFITAEHIDKIYEEMQPGESLLIACKSYQEACENRHANISIKKIPHLLLGRCEYGKDDYSFNILNMRVDEDAEPLEATESAHEALSNKANKTNYRP